MKQLIMCYLGEMALKGLNKSTFEAQLMKTIRNRIKKAIAVVDQQQEHK